jgi:asparagine synthase (glutamine-hydrolysing)
MCGIAGVLTDGGVDPGLLRRMAGWLAHRGPDDEGFWCDGDAGIGLAHRRLAIVDLSPEGHQPMASADGRWQIILNGEIYNHASIRRRLEDQGAVPHGGWRGHSDTETLLQAISIRGLERALDECVGMFAMALWDRRERQLLLIRDRFGEKPLYYGWAGRDFVFASELKAIVCHPGFQREIDRGSLSIFASRGYVPAPRSIYRRTYKLEPGCILKVDHRAVGAPTDAPPSEAEGSLGLSLKRFWAYRSVVQRGLSNPMEDEREMIDQLEAVLGQAIEEQSLADVPVGAFLSGGIDSSSIVALYQRRSSKPVQTYTLGFKEEDFDEAAYARAIAQHLGTVHHEHYVGEAEACDVIPQLPSIYDEPFADSSQIPTFLISRFARTDVTVALTGDGGDELFGGYNRHVFGPRMWGALAHIPRPVRAAAGALANLPTSVWSGLLPGPRAHSGAKIAKSLKIAATAGGLEDVYGGFIDEWRFLPSPVIGGATDQAFDLDPTLPCPDAVRLMYGDAVGYLPDDILHKVDRAAMAVSLETRLPFLDHRVAELAARIPLHFKIRGNMGKWMLRELLARHVPRGLFERPKAGFAVPVGEWMKGPLRPWAESLLDPSSMRLAGFFAPEVVQKRWQDHLSGRRDSTAAIWAILMFQAWLRQQEEAETPAVS